MQLDTAQPDSGTRGQVSRNTCSPSQTHCDTRLKTQHYYHLNTCQCPASKLFSCWGWSCRIKQYIMTSYKWAKNNLPPFFTNPQIKPIIITTHKSQFSPIGNHCMIGFYFSSFSPPKKNPFHLFHLLTQNPKSEKIYIFSQKYVSYILLTYSKGKASGIHHTSIKPLANT